jgi:hypothetical protein
MLRNQIYANGLPTKSHIRDGRYVTHTPDGEPPRDA